MGRPRDIEKRHGPGRPKGAKDKVARPPRARRKASEIVELIEGACRSSKKGPVNVAEALRDVKVRWEDLEAMALAFLHKGLELLPFISRASDAIICADRIMAILERRTEMQSAARDVLAEHGISLHFSSAAELGIEPKKEEG
jgi:hypothetical protein